MSDYAFNKYETLWSEIHAIIDSTLEEETNYVREYIVEKLNDEFRFLDHLFPS